MQYIYKSKSMCKKNNIYIYTPIDMPKPALKPTSPGESVAPLCSGKLARSSPKATGCRRNRRHLTLQRACVSLVAS